MNLMILAAGLGTRLAPYTNEKPKPAIPFLGVPLSAYCLALLDGLKCDRLVVNTHHLPKQVENLFRDLKVPARSLHFTPEQPNILGSGGGIHNAANILKGNGDFFVMNGDEVVVPHEPWVLKEMLAAHRWSKSIATLLVMEHPEVGKKFGGVWVNPAEKHLMPGQEKVRAFSKTPIAGLKGYHFLGVMILQDRIFQYFKSPVQDENILYETLTKAMAAKEDVSVFSCKVEWFENGNPEDFLRSSKYYCEQLMPFLRAKQSQPYWKNYLAGVLRYYGERKKFVEVNDSQLSQKLDELWALL